MPGASSVSNAIPKIKNVPTSIRQTDANMGTPAAEHSGQTPIATPIPSGMINRRSSSTSPMIASFLATSRW